MAYSGAFLEEAVLPDGIAGLDGDGRVLVVVVDVVGEHEGGDGSRGAVAELLEVVVLQVVEGDGEVA